MACIFVYICIYIYKYIYVNYARIAGAASRDYNDYVITESWRGIERSYDGNMAILPVWKAWSRVHNEVIFLYTNISTLFFTKNTYNKYEFICIYNILYVSIDSAPGCCPPMLFCLSINCDYITLVRSSGKKLLAPHAKLRI